MTSSYIYILSSERKKSENTKIKRCKEAAKLHNGRRKREGERAGRGSDVERGVFFVCFERPRSTNEKAKIQKESEEVSSHLVRDLGGGGHVR